MANPTSRTYKIEISYNTGSQEYEFNLPYEPGTYGVKFLRDEEVVKYLPVTVNGLPNSYDVEIVDGLQVKHNISFTTPVVKRTFTLDNSAIDWSYVNSVIITYKEPGSSDSKEVKLKNWGDKDGWSQDFPYNTQITLKIDLKDQCRFTSLPNGISLKKNSDTSYASPIILLTSDITVKEAGYDLQMYTIKFGQDEENPKNYGYWSKTEVEVYANSEWEIDSNKVTIKRPGLDQEEKTVYYLPYITNVEWELSTPYPGYCTWKLFSNSNIVLPNDFLTYSIKKAASNATSGTITNNTAFTGEIVWKTPRYSVSYGGTTPSESAYSGNQTAELTLVNGTKIGTLTTNNHTAQYYYTITDIACKETVFDATLVLRFDPTVIRTTHKYTVTYKQGNASSAQNLPKTQSFEYGDSVTLATNNMTKNDTFGEKYTVTFNPNGGFTEITSSIVFERHYYNASGWTTNPSSSSPTHSNGATYGSNANITLYPCFKQNTETPSVTLPTPTRTGYVFKGWATSSTATTGQYSGGASYTPTASVTLYAVWSPQLKAPEIISAIMEKTDGMQTSMQASLKVQNNNSCSVYYRVTWESNDGTGVFNGPYTGSTISIGANSTEYVIGMTNASGVTYSIYFVCDGYVDSEAVTGTVGLSGSTEETTTTTTTFY